MEIKVIWNIWALDFIVTSRKPMFELVIQNLNIELALSL